VELVIDTTLVINDDGGMVIVAFMNDILIATKGSLEKHDSQVSNVFLLLMDNDMCVEIDKCIFEAKQVPFLGLIVSGCGLKMDPEKRKPFLIGHILPMLKRFNNY
jgi:hypothetical protein